MNTTKCRSFKSALIKPIMLKIKEKSRKATFKKKRDNCARKKIKKLLKYLRSELGSSTTHGLPYIVNTDIHWFERVFWTISFILAVALTFFLLSMQFIRFVEQPLVMSVEKDYFNWNISYPTLLLCPLNKVDEELILSFSNESFLLSGQDLSSYLEAIAVTTLDTINVLQLPDAETLPLINSSDYARLAAAVLKPFENESLISNILSPMSVEPVMTEMGMCHMINSNVAVFDNPSKWSDADVSYTKNNIELSFYDQDFYVQLMNYADTYKIYVQGPDDVVLVGASAQTFDSEGYLHIGVRAWSTRASEDLRLMPLFLRKCRFVDEPNTKRYPVYSYNRCLMECRIRVILKLCNCVPHFYKPLENEKVCNLAELTCLADYLKDLQTLSISNDTISMFEDADLPRNSRDCGCLGDCQSDIYLKDPGEFIPQEGLNQLKVTVSAFPRVRIVRDRIFSFYDAILRSGGVINFCIGSSVISIMELLMTVIRIPIYATLQLLHYIYRTKGNAKTWPKKTK